MFGKLREKYQEIMAPVGRSLSRTGLTPNLVTAMSLPVSLASAYTYGTKKPIVGALLIILIGLIDMLDGAIARAKGQTTRFGATLDHVLDRYAECFIVLGIIYGGYTDWFFGTFSLFGMLMASYTRAKAESVGGIASCTVGIAERQEKLMLIILGSLLLPLFPYIQTLNYTILLTGILSHITVIQRLDYTWKHTRGV